MDALTFLESVAGYTRAQTDGSADKPILLGTIDPAYTWANFVAGTLPKVTFDGESTLSGKRYPFLHSYVPRASDRVALAPVGTTYMIIGSLDGQPGPLGILDYVDETTNSASTSGTSPLTILTSNAVTPIRTGRSWRISLHARGYDPALQDAGIYVKAIQDNGTEIGDNHDILVNNQQSVLVPFSALMHNVSVTSHTFTAVVNRATGASTAQVSAEATSPYWLMVEDIGPTPAHLL